MRPMPAFLVCPLRRYYVEVMAARTLAGGGFEAGAVSAQAGPAALGAPSALAAAPSVTAVTSDGSPKATVEVCNEALWAA